MDTPDLAGLSQAMQLRIMEVVVALKLLGSFISSVRNGGGLVRIVKSFFFGENLPKVIAQDYQAELSAKPKDTSQP